MHFCFRKRIHHQMECAAVDGRGGAVHSHRALYAPLRTPDGELRCPQEKKFNLKWGRGRHDEEPEKFRFLLEYIIAYLLHGTRFLRSSRRVRGMCMVMWMNRKLCSQTDNWFTIDRHQYIPSRNGLRFRFMYCSPNGTIIANRIERFSRRQQGIT